MIQPHCAITWMREKKKSEKYGGVSPFYFVFTSLLSLSRFENDAAPKEDEDNQANPPLHIF